MKNTKFLVLVILLIALCGTVYSFWDVCLTFLTAAIAAYLLNPLARFIARKTRIPHGVCVALVLILFLGVAVMLLSMLVPYAYRQIDSLVREISAYARSFDSLVKTMTEYLRGLHIPEVIIDKAAELLANSDTYLAALFSGVATALLNISLGVLDLIVIVILVIYFMLDGKKLKEALLAALPNLPRRSAQQIMATSNELTQKYIKSRVLISLGMAIVIYIGFTIMGISYAPLFAILSFVLDFIPYFGSLIAGVIEAVYALITGGVGLAVTVAIFVLIVQQIEGNVVAPKIQGEATGIHPITVMFALLCCNQLFGPVGMLISTPMAVVIKTVVKEAYRYVVSPDDTDPDQLTIEQMDEAT